MNTIDGVAHVLPGGHDQAEGEHERHRDGVVEPEDRGVDGDARLLDQGLETPEHVQHPG